MMLEKLRVLLTEIRRLKRKTCGQSARNTRVIYGKGVEGCSTSPWRQTESQEVNREIWAWCRLLRRLSQQRRSVKYLSGVPRWPLPLNLLTKASQAGLIYMKTGHG